MNKYIVELINRKENQILIHSAIYYRFNDNLIPDWQYDSIGKDLIELAHKYPEEFKMSYHYKDFIEYVNKISNLNCQKYVEFNYSNFKKDNFT